MSSAMAIAQAHHEATEHELREAYEVRRAMARSPFPATFEEAMADPMTAGLIRLHAERVAMLPPAPRARPAATLDVPRCRIHATPCDEVRPSRRCANCTLRPPRLQHFTPPPGFVDRKRAASGDRDD